MEMEMVMLMHLYGAYYTVATGPTTTAGTTMTEPQDGTHYWMGSGRLVRTDCGFLGGFLYYENEEEVAEDWTVAEDRRDAEEATLYLLDVSKVIPVMGWWLQACCRWRRHPGTWPFRRSWEVELWVLRGDATRGMELYEWAACRMGYVPVVHYAQAHADAWYYAFPSTDNVAQTTSCRWQWTGGDGPEFTVWTQYDASASPKSEGTSENVATTKGGWDAADLRIAAAGPVPGPLPGPTPRGPPPTARQVLIRLLQKTPKQGGELPPQQQMMTGATSKAEARCRMRGLRSSAMGLRPRKQAAATNPSMGLQPVVRLRAPWESSNNCNWANRWWCGSDGGAVTWKGFGEIRFTSPINDLELFYMITAESKFGDLSIWKPEILAGSLLPCRAGCGVSLCIPGLAPCARLYAL